MYLETDPETIDVDQLPANFRWDDINGYDFTADVADQGACGSCYKISINSILESRIKLWFLEDHRLSVQHRLDCDFMNEGCHGGWGYFDGLFLE